MANVQKQMVRLSEYRLVSTERVCHELTEDRERLTSYVMEEGALGASLARAALRSLNGLDRRIAAAERQREAGKASLTASKRREHVVDELAASAATEARRAADRADLAETIEAWLAARGTSLR